MSFCIKNDILHLRRAITLLKQEFDQKITLLQTELNDISDVTSSTFTNDEGLILITPDIYGKYELQETTEDAIFMVNTKDITQTKDKKTIYLSQDKKSIIIFGDDNKWYVIQFIQPYNINNFDISNHFSISSETVDLTSSISIPVADSITSF